MLQSPANLNPDPNPTPSQNHHTNVSANTEWPGNAMASYDTGSLTTVHDRLAQREILRLTAPEAGQAHSLQLSLSQLPAMDTFEHELNFDGDTFVCVIPLLLHPPPPPSSDRAKQGIRSSTY